MFTLIPDLKAEKSKTVKYKRISTQQQKQNLKNITSATCDYTLCMKSYVNKKYGNQNYLFV